MILMRQSILELKEGARCSCQPPEAATRLAFCASTRSAMATLTTKSRGGTADQSPRRHGGGAAKHTPAKTPPKTPRAAAPTSSPKRKLDFDATAGEDNASARFSLQMPDGSEWISESWLATVDRMKLLQQNAEDLASTAAARSASAALARVVRECEAGDEQARGRARGGLHKGGSMSLARSQLCARFNKASAASKRAPLSTVPSPPALVTHVLDIAYDVAVTNPRQLNKYRPFSREVYGETNASLVQHIIETQKITDSDTFFDLGSGIGQVVLQAAATTGCRAFGVELMDAPAGYAAALQVAFEAEYVPLTRPARKARLSDTR